MRYGLKQMVTLARTPAGRFQIADGLRYRAWPLLAPLSKLYRSTLTRQTQVIAVVGSFGKSTTTQAIATALAIPLYHRFTYNCWSGVALAMLRMKRSQKFGVLEVGISGKGQMMRYANIVRPDIAVVTSIGSEHNRSLPSLEDTRHEKAEMVRRLSGTGTAVLNGDDANVMWMKSQTQGRIYTFGFLDSNDVRASNVRFEWPHGMRFTLRVGQETREMMVHLLGEHMLYPILAAVAVGHVAGLPLNDMIPRLEALRPVEGRMQPVALPNGAWILRDDFKSHLETMRQALEALAKISDRRRLLVLGAISDIAGTSGPFYREIGARLGTFASFLLTIGTKKEMASYAAGAARAGLPRSAIAHAGHSLQKAIDILQQQLQPGDVVLIKGRFEQHLERITLALLGRKVHCDIDPCWLKRHCENCPMLETGWKGIDPIT